MSDAYIEILDTTNSVLGNIYVSDNDDFPLALSDKISDISEILKGGTSSSSKTFRFPATNEINVLLGYLYNANISDDKDMKNIKPCRLIVDGQQYLNYNKIKITDVIEKNGRPVEYEAVLYGENYEWVDAAKETMITDLDYYDGTTDIIDYTKASLNAAFPTTYDSGWDYWWSLKNYGAWKNGSNATVEDFRPDIYIKSIEEKFFARIGYTLESDFKDGSIYKKLLFPFIGGSFSLGEDIIAANKISVETNAVQSITGAVGDAVSFANEIQDDNNLWTSSNTFTCARSGKYRISGIIDLGFIVYAGVATASLKLRKNGVDTQMYDSSGAIMSMQVPSSQFPSGVGLSTYFFDFDQDLISGDVVQIFCSFSSSFAPLWLARVSFQTTSSLSISLKTDIIEGSTFKINEVFPNDISVLDVMNGCTDLFNLYWKTDTRLKKVYCEPRNEFYKPISQAIDWTNKLDLSSEYKLSFITDYKRDWSFSYSEDSNDKLVAEENKKSKRVLAELKISLPDRFQKGTQKAGTNFFAPTISKIAEEISPTGLQDAPTIPTFKNEYPKPSQYSTDFKPRILYQEGMVTKTTSYGYTARWRFHDRLTGGVQIKTQVPLAYMADGLAGVGANLMYCNGTVEGDGLFKTYWDKTFQVLETGEILTCKLRLNSTELSTIDLRYPVYFDTPAEIKGYWAIDSLGDYKPQDLDLVPAKLVRLEEVTPKTTTSVTDGLETASETGGGFGGVFKTDPTGGSTGDNGAKRPVTTMNSGAGNVSRDTGNVVWGNGLIGDGVGQIVLGKFNVASETDKLIIGAGISDSDRRNFITIDENDNLKVFGGQVFFTDGDGNIQPVYSTDENGNVNFVYLK